MYQFNIVQFLLSIDEHIARLKKAERINQLWKVTGIFVIASMVVYGCMGYVGIGSGMLLQESLLFSPDVYESSKFWFFIGKILLGFIFALFIIVVPAALFKWLTNIYFKKLVVMQLVVLFVLLLERIVWFFLVVTAGLEWYVSPFAFGIIASYFTSQSWVITFFGVISVAQIWIIWFQVTYIGKLMKGEGKAIIWISVILLHVVQWSMVTLSVVAVPSMIGRWFG